MDVFCEVGQYGLGSATFTLPSFGFDNFSLTARKTYVHCIYATTCIYSHKTYWILKSWSFKGWRKLPQDTRAVAIQTCSFLSRGLMRVGCSSNSSLRRVDPIYEKYRARKRYIVLFTWKTGPKNRRSYKAISPTWRYAAMPSSLQTRTPSTGVCLPRDTTPYHSTISQPRHTTPLDISRRCL